MKRPVTAFNVLIDACWKSINNSKPSKRAKNEERLAGQSVSLHNSRMAVFLQESVPPNYPFPQNLQLETKAKSTTTAAMDRHGNGHRH